MKKYWILANVLFIIAVAVCVYIDASRLKTFGPAEYSERVVPVESTDNNVPGDVDYFLNVNARAPYAILNLSAYKFASNFLELTYSGMAFYRFGFPHIELQADHNTPYATYRVTDFGGTFLDQIFIGKYRKSFTLGAEDYDAEKYFRMVTQSIGAEQIVWHQIFWGRVAFLGMITLAVLLLTNLIFGALFWVRSVQHKRKDLIEEVTLKIESEPFKEFWKLANNPPRGIFGEAEWLLHGRVSEACFLLWKLKRKELSLKKFKQELVELEFDTMFLEVVTRNQRVQQKLDALHYARISDSYACMPNENSGRGTLVTKVETQKVSTTASVTSSRDKFNELKKRIDGMLAKLNGAKTEDRAKLKAIKLLLPTVKKLDELMVMISDEFNRSDGKVKLKRFDHVEKRVKAAETSLEELKLPAESQSQVN